MTLPRGYNRALQRYDAWLRMRWSPAKEHWVLERKANFGRLDRDPATLPHDTYVQLRDGYQTLWTYPPRGLPPIDVLLRVLKWGDTWRMQLGADELDQAARRNDQQREDTADAAARQNDQAIAADSWDDYAWAAGQRVSVPDTIH